MNLDARAIQDELDQRLRAGRHPWEAAGEYRWLWELERRNRLVSNQTHSAMLQIADEWMAARMKIPPDELAGPRMLAEMYARFLAESVEIAEVDPPPWQALESAWHRWRERSGT